MMMRRYLIEINKMEEHGGEWESSTVNYLKYSSSHIYIACTELADPDAICDMWEVVFHDS